jgi:hypothetical protein
MNRMSLICGAIVLGALPSIATSAMAAGDQDAIIRRLDKSSSKRTPGSNKKMPR